MNELLSLLRKGGYSMGELIDFEKRRAKKELKDSAGNKGIVYEIYLAVVKYVNEHLQEEYEKPIENLNTKTHLRLVYQGDYERFQSTLNELLEYWEIPKSYVTHIPDGEEFEVFETVGDLCTFIDKCVRKQGI
ncbi:hypothetical protein [Pontibacillus sp. HMF3514]|uniref:hypothetical protein n=1 Tax=Pontibacillus sp. HMF3514 TaxID=2692425 RepID=UPI00131FD6C3|nr:hypothetical protein [Pontibacillus sp. HMF3514]QHE51933.1 hypothetical protein GS400_07770 [Pontibacillus sp. HMF3514]